MADHSSIEWTEATWNPVLGCTKVSPGCDHCYAERIDERFHGKGSFAVVRRSEEKLYLPLKWRKPRRVFVNSMSDLFHDDVPVGFIHRVFSVMAQTPQHTYQILTKRHGRMRSLLSDPAFPATVNAIANEDAGWPLSNVWLGVSAENQQWADIRIPALWDTPAAVRWLSCEPLLGPINLDPWRNPGDVPDPRTPADSRLDWVVVGGESGPGARPMHPDWARSLRDQCATAGVPFFFKQWGEWLPLRGHREFMDLPPARINRDWARPFDDDDVTMCRVGKKAAGRELDGRTWDEYPVEVGRG